MSQLERQNEILNVLNNLKDGKSVSIKELAAMLYSSQSSVRRDVIKLENRGLVTHIYGGVMSAQHKNIITPVCIRDAENLQAKEKIAAEAAKLVNSGDVIFMDSSSTVRRMIPYLKNLKDLRIITNNLKIFAESEELDAEIYCTGGKYNPKNGNFCGAMARESLNKINADIMFFSSQGLSENGEITDVSEDETAVRAAMLKRAKKKVFLCDFTKIGVRRFVSLCNVKEVDEIICDDKEKIEEIMQKVRQSE